MTEKQKIFIDVYVKTKNASESAREAGYSKRTAAFIGAENLKKPQINEAIQARIKELATKYNLSRDDYIKKTIILHEESKHPSTRQRYWELLGKVLGYNKETLDLKTPFTPPPIYYNTIITTKPAEKTTKPDTSRVKQCLS